MRRIVICILALSLMLSFAACGGNTGMPNSSATPQAPALETPESSYSTQSPDTARMMETIAKLSQIPRGHDNKEGLTAARNLISDTFKSYGLEVTIQEFSVPREEDEGDYTAVNIIGILHPNTANETTDVLVVGAHYDGSVGFPSANDNGSGIAVLLELARLLQESKTDTEIRFVAFDAEETGLWGSEHYVDTLMESDADRVVGMLNFDMLAAAKAGQVLAYLADDDENFLSRILKGNPEFSDIELAVMPYGGSDHSSFAAKAIPTLSFSHEPVDGEYHSEDDITRNIDPALLAYAASAGQAIIDDIASEKTLSYAGVAKPKLDSSAVYAIDANTFFPASESKKTIESKTSIQLTHIESQDSNMLYAARVKLFGMPETLILTASIPASSTYGFRVNLGEAGISLARIAAVLDNALGPKQEVESDRGTQYKWYNMFGNIYSILFDRENGELHLDIGAYDIDISEGYTVEKGELVRMEDADPFGGVNIAYTKKGNGIIRTEHRNKPSDTLPVTDAAKESWKKIKAYLTPEELANIGFLLLTTDGIGANVLSLTWENEPDIAAEPPMLPYLEEGESASTSHALPGLHISFDYLDITNPNGTAYTETDFAKAIHTARTNYAGSNSATQ